MDIISLLRLNRNFFIILSHCLLIILAYLLSFALRFEFSFSLYFAIILKTLPFLILIKILALYYTGIIHSSLRYASMIDLWHILKINTISSIIFVLTVVFIFGTWGYPRSIFILEWGISLSLFAGLRFLIRYFNERMSTSFSQEREKSVLIIGAGEAGILILRENEKNVKMNWRVVGFIDDDPTKKNLMIYGKKVLGTREDIPSLVKKYNVEELVIAIPSAKGEVIRSLINQCQLPNIKLKIVPQVHRILDGSLQIQLREVQPEDLLGREAVNIDIEEIENYIKEKLVLVTGAGGSIGSELSRQIAQYQPKHLILLDHNENDIYFLEIELRKDFPDLKITPIIVDIGEISVLKYAFSHFLPQIVFHAAAFKHVPLMEQNPSAAVKNNIIASRNLIYACHHYKVESFVLISTDKAVNPTSIMGAAKRIAEMTLQAKSKTSKTKLIAVRFGNVLGSKGSVIPLFKKQIAQGGPVTVTHPETRRYFMSVKEAVALVLQAAAIGKGGEIFILDMGEQIKIVDLAKNLINLSGLKPDVDISIKFIGMRPGEKLYEETLLDTEKDKATKYNKIFVAQPNNFDSKQLRKDVKYLERLARLMDEQKIYQKIKEMVMEK